jgi:hypothetical protein
MTTLTITDGCSRVIIEHETEQHKQTRKAEPYVPLRVRSPFRREEGEPPPQAIYQKSEWRGTTPKAYLYELCQKQRIPMPVFSHENTAIGGAVADFKVSAEVNGISYTSAVTFPSHNVGEHSISILVLKDLTGCTTNTAHGVEEAVLVYLGRRQPPPLLLSRGPTTILKRPTLSSLVTDFLATRNVGEEFAFGDVLRAVQQHDVGSTNSAIKSVLYQLQKEGVTMKLEGKRWKKMPGTLL